MSEITETDVRLIRRYLVAKNTGHERAAQRVLDYLRARPFKMILPDKQTHDQRVGYWSMLRQVDREMAAEYGSVLLPEYKDTIFLNTEWRNPKTLYVRLNRRVPELGELGEIVWIPGEPEQEPTLWDRFLTKLKG